MATRIPAGEAPRYYDLRASDPAVADAEFDRSGFQRIDPAAARAGDVLVTRPGPARLHVVILTGEGYLHADARLRRVAEVPGPVPWPILSAWRHPDEEALPAIPAARLS